jgi:hypothetical protein
VLAEFTVFAAVVGPLLHT